MTQCNMSVKDQLRQLTSPDYFEREEAVRRLGQSGGDDAVAGLVMALEDENRGVRELAADYLTHCGGDLCTRLLASFLAHEDISVRHLASEVLVNIGPEAVPALADALTDPQQEVRQFALDALGLIGDSSVVDRVHCLLDDPGAGVACSAAEALGYFGIPQSVPHLLRAFEQHVFLRPQAAEALGRIGDPMAFKGLSKYLDIDDAVLLYSVIEALGRLSHPAGVDVLKPLLNHDNKMIADAAAAAVIRTMLATNRKADESIPRGRLKRFLLESLSSNDPTTVQFSVGALYQWDGLDMAGDLIACLKRADTALINPIADVLKSYEEPGLEQLAGAFKQAVGPEKIRLLTAAARIADPLLTPAVARLAEAEEVDIRVQVAYTLGQCGDHTALDTLADLASDPDDSVRSASLKAIGWIGIETEIALLIGGLDDAVEEVRRAAIGALILIGGDPAIRAFTVDLEHPAPRRRKMAALALGMIGEEATRQPLRQAVYHADADVRRAAIEALSRIGNLNDADIIRSVLTDDDMLVRKAAISGLADLVGREAVEDIKPLLDEDDVWIKCHAIDTIGLLGDDDQADLIASFLNDSQDIVIVSAVKALAAMGAHKYRKQLQKIPTKGNSDLTTAVEEAANQLTERYHG